MLLVLKISSSCSNAVVCSGPNVGNSEAGIGFQIVWIRSQMAWMALSLLDIFDIGAMCGKNLMLPAVLTPPVEGI